MPKPLKIAITVYCLAFAAFLAATAAAGMPWLVLVESLSLVAVVVFESVRAARKTRHWPLDK